MALINAADHHHAHQDLKLVDMARVARKKRLDSKWPVCLNDHVDPGAGISTRGNVSTMLLTCTMTMPLLKAAASTITGVSSVLGPV